jgi:PAS domain S-box-containing protein
MAQPLTPEASAGTIRWAHIGKTIFRAAVCIATVIAVIAVLSLVRVQHDRLLSAALNLFLFAVLIVSLRWGTRYAIFLSILSALSFSWLLPPAGHFHFTDGRVWTLLTACVVTGVVGSKLSSRLRRAVLDANQRHGEAVAEQKRFRDLVNSVEGIVWEADPETFVFSFVSEQAERILGYPTDNWIKEPAFWKEHLHPEDRESAVQFCLQATAQKRSHDFEYRMIAADGRVVWIRDLVTVVVENERAVRLQGVMVDITTRRRNEEALKEQAHLLSLTHDAVAVRDMNRFIKY